MIIGNIETFTPYTTDVMERLETKYANANSIQTMVDSEAEATGHMYRVYSFARVVSHGVGVFGTWMVGLTPEKEHDIITALTFFGWDVEANKLIKTRGVSESRGLWHEWVNELPALGYSMENYTKKIGYEVSQA